MSGPSNPVQTSSGLVDPPVANLPWGELREHGMIYLTVPAFQFLQGIWAALQGQGGVIDTVDLSVPSPGQFLGLSEGVSIGIADQEALGLTQPAIGISVAKARQLAEDAGLIASRPAQKVNPANLPSSVMFAQTSTVTVANTTAETTLIGTGVGSITLPPNFLKPGTCLAGVALGPHSAVSNPSIRLRAYLGSTVILDTGIVNSANSTNATWEFRGWVTCRAQGTSGVITAQGFYMESGSGPNVFGMVNTSTITIDTTVPQTVNFTVQWGTASASNTISCPLLILQGYQPPS